MVLCGSADHCRSPDIDELSHLKWILGALSAEILQERIEVHHNDIDRADLGGFHLGEVALRVATRQDAAVDLRMEGLYAPVEQLG